MSKYYHLEKIHNLDCSKDLSIIIFNQFNPKSILDVGCGTGNFLKNFQELGVAYIEGIDGDHLDLSNIFIDKEKINICDLEKTFNLNRKFDLLICLEVAEHISNESAQNFIQSLCQHSDIIVFSAAIPFQGGQNHINEQWQMYWINQFSKFNFFPSFNLREEIWNNENIFWWYKQNILVFQKETPRNFMHNMANIVHPDLYLKKSKELEEVLCGKLGIYHSLKIFINSIYHKIKLS
jgi:SAM-dependent methyltransferase